MIMDFDIKNFFYGFFNLLDSRIAKLFYFPCIGIYKMIVLMIKIRFFILSLISSKLVLSDETALKK